MTIETCPKCGRSRVVVFETKYPKTRRQRYHDSKASGYTDTQTYHCICVDCGTKFRVECKNRVRVRK